MESHVKLVTGTGLEITKLGKQYDKLVRHDTGTNHDTESILEKKRTNRQL